MENIPNDIKHLFSLLTKIDFRDLPDNSNKKYVETVFKEGATEYYKHIYPAPDDIVRGIPLYLWKLKKPIEIINYIKLGSRDENE